MKSIYVIRNKVACENVTDICVYANDSMAAIAFRSFLLSMQNAAKTKNLPCESDRHFTLVRIGAISSDNILVPEEDDVSVVATGLDECQAIIDYEDGK